MASKKTKAAAADDNLDELFSGIGNDSKSKKPSKASKPTSAAAKAINDNDILADLESELAHQQSSSRPHTPRLKETIARRSTATPPAGDERATTAAAARKSTDSARSLRASFTPSATSSDLHESEKRGTVEQETVEQEQQQEQQPQQSGGGWWGGIMSTATAAMKQAEAAYKEIQQNEEAKKWADQVRGLKDIDVGTLKSYGKYNRYSLCFQSTVHQLTFASLSRR